MSGSMSIPNHIGSQSGPRIQAALFDDNWEHIEAYVNEREITFNVAANRPLPGVSGRWFYATDQSTLYVDTGVNWITLVGGGAGGLVAPLAGSVSQRSVPESSEVFTLAAARVVVVSLSGDSAHTLTGVSVRADLSAMGAGGRDHATKFAPHTWVHLYWIYNPQSATVQGLISAAPWPAAPLLPATFSEVAYAGAVKLDGAGGFRSQEIHGRRTEWTEPMPVLTGGTASTPTAVHLAAAVPTNAVRVSGTMTMRSTSAPAEDARGVLLWSDNPTHLVSAQASTWETAARGALYYSVPAGHELAVHVTAFENPNGG